MANVYGNQFARRRGGVCSQELLIHQTRSGKTIVADMPISDNDMTYMEGQRMHHAALRIAATYACFAENMEAYICLAQQLGTTAYSVAFADWYSAPRVLEIDVDRWTGNPGETIRVKARDHRMVTSVMLAVRDPQGQLLEMGKALQSEAGSTWWNYTTQSRVPMTPFPTIQATAFNLPGNIDSFTIS